MWNVFESIKSEVIGSKEHLVGFEKESNLSSCFLLELLIEISTLNFNEGYFCLENFRNDLINHHTNKVQYSGSRDTRSQYFLQNIFKTEHEKQDFRSSYGTFPTRLRKLTNNVNTKSLNRNCKSERNFRSFPPSITGRKGSFTFENYKEEKTYSTKKIILESNLKRKNSRVSKIERELKQINKEITEGLIVMSSNLNFIISEQSKVTDQVYDNFCIIDSNIKKTQTTVAKKKQNVQIKPNEAFIFSLNFFLTIFILINFY